MNNGLMGGILFNQTNLIEVQVENVSFNGFGLYNSNIIALGVTRDYNSLELNTFQIPQQNGNGFISSFNRGINFSINFAIKGNDQNSVDTLYDNMLIKLSYKNGTFKYKPFGGNFREITANMIGITTTERTSKYITGIINFTSIEPFWRDSVVNSTLESGIVLSPFNIQVVNNGLNSLSIIYIIFGSGNSGVTSISITGNNRTISFSGTLSDGDILVIDNQNKQVLLNDVLQEYTGTFFDLINGVNSLLFTINGTFNIDASIVYPTNYLMP